jgi:crossover junction endodeoxyribonuclease RusA
MIEATLPLPPSANALFANRRGGGRVKTGDYKAWLDEAGWHLKAQWLALGQPAFDAQPMRLTITAGIGRHRDLSNTCKAIEDLIVAILPVPDDRWNDHIVLRRGTELGLAHIRLEPIDTT